MMNTRFAKFFSGRLIELVHNITLPSVNRLEEDGIYIQILHVHSETTLQEKAVLKAKKLAKEGNISRAI